ARGGLPTYLLHFTPPALPPRPGATRGGPSMRTRMTALLVPPLALLLAAAGPAAQKDRPDRPPPRDRDAALKLFAEDFVPSTPGAGKFPASFRMGSADGPAEERPAHTVRLPQADPSRRPFAVAKYEVTQELYQAVMGKNPSKWK